MIISSIYQGLLYGILGLGIYMTFRILDFPDLTTEGSFPLGGAVAVTLMNFGWNPILATIVITALIAFLNTRLGQAYIATGDNRDMAKSFGINTDNMEVMGLVISNGIIALSGALISQQDGYADVSKGIGVIVIGLASIIIGEVLYATNLTLLERLIAICIGSILYQFLLTAVIALGFNTNYLKLFSAIVLAICLISPVLRRKFFKGVTLSR